MNTEQDLIYWITTFYLLEDMHVRFKPYEASPARLKLQEDVLEKRRSYNNLLASLLFDTIVKMCFGEARHADDRCGIIISEIAGIPDRKTAYRTAEDYAPHDSLTKLRDLFLECWLQPYGGVEWAIICESALKYGTMPPEIFVDHCADLSHHGGLVFNKIESGFHVWHKRRYLDILDLKKNGSLLDIDSPLPVFSFAETLLIRAHNLGLIGKIPVLSLSEKCSYQPVQWGRNVLSQPVSLYEVTA